MNHESQRASDSVIQAVTVPKEVFNADSVFLIAWSVKNGSSIEQGATICEIETSKSVSTIAAERSGYLRQVASAGEEVKVGGILGYITSESDTPIPSTSITQESARSGPRISSKARLMIERFDLDEKLFSNYALVREQDVLKLAGSEASSLIGGADQRGSSEVYQLGAIQRRVATVLEKSSRVPVSYVEKRIDLQRIKNRAAQESKNNGTMVTVLDVLVTAVSHACLNNLNFNAFLDSQYRLKSFLAVHTALAVEVEADLYVVVVRNAGDKDIGAISKELRGLEYKAHRRRLTDAEMSGATITVTSLLGTDVHRFQPLLYPEQAAIVGICNSESGPNYAQLTLGFDHRIANGTEAAKFIGEIYGRMCESKIMDVTDSGENVDAE